MENEGLRFEVRALRDSTSWKVTAPIRWCSRGIRRCGQGIRSFAVAFLRVVYHSLPFPAYRKNGLKGWFYSKLPLVFRHTVSYRYWKLNQPVDALRPKSNGLQKESKAQGVVQYLSDLFSYSDDRETYVPLKDSPKIDPVIRLIAFYLPQFHSIPENDEWWGKGFSEWRNVTRAKPQFVGHYQPHLPGELGFYDLRLIEIQKRQIEVARMYGIYGFCYHYYWFGGKRLLERPLNQVLANKELDFPFCICWANENWTRRWDGLEEEVLIGQNHSPEDDLAFIQSLEPVLRDDRYIRIDDRPLIIVYRPELLPEAKATVNRWRSYCHEVGIGEICLALTHAFENRDPRDFGFDAAIEFPPNNSAAPTLNGEVELLNPNYRGIIYDYRYFLERSRKYKKEDYKLFRGVTPGWDNEARKPGRGTTFLFSTPDAYAEWLDNACRATLEEFEGDERIIFVNAWNEWAEGCHLEPDQKYGYAYLQKTADALARVLSEDIGKKSGCISRGRSVRAEIVNHVDSENSSSRTLARVFDREIENGDRIYDEWFNLICKSLESSLVQYKGITLPGFPDHQTQINTVGSAGKSNLIEADVFFRDVVRHFCSSPNWLDAEKSILDFGCGWGRIARFFLLHFKAENILGIDIDNDLLDICRNTFKGPNFLKCQAFPPTAFEDDSIDFIVGYSVFSHLSEAACLQWMNEFRRILRTGGMAALTTRGRPFFDYCMSLKGTKQSGYAEALSRLFDDFDTAKSKYDAGEFVHSNVKGVTGGGVREGQFYGETFIPERYAREALSEYLKLVEFGFDIQRSIHPTIYFQKE